MANIVARHLRYAWFEYEDADDAVSFDRTFSSSAMGWRNVFLDLGAIGERAWDLAHPDLPIKWEWNSDKSQDGLIAFPLDSHAEFIARWLMSPGVNELTSKLTLGSDATDYAELVSISGHHSGGSVQSENRKPPARINLGNELRDVNDAKPGGHLKYLMIPACYACNLDAATAWLPLFTRGIPIHGVLGYSATYKGDKTGAQLMQNFGLALKRNPKLTILEAWAKANGSEPWGAVMHAAAIGDTMDQWMSDAGLGSLAQVSSASSVRVIQFDQSNLLSGGMVVPMDTPDFEAKFHRADGKEIRSGNNSASDVPRSGLIPGQSGYILIKTNNGRTFSSGQKISIVFHYYRPQKRDMNLDTLLRFSPSLLQNDSTLGAPKLRLLRDSNPQKEGGPTGFNDGIEYTLGSGEQEVRIDYTVLPDAARNYHDDGGNWHTHGRFMLYLFPPGTLTSNPRTAISMYKDGAWLFDSP